MGISSTSGLFSGIDYQALITQLVKSQSAPIDQLQSRKADYAKANSAYAAMKTRVEDLKSAADSLRTVTGFKQFTTSSTHDTIATASAGTSASAGTYNVVVSTLAKAHKMISTSGAASETTAVAAGAGSFVFKVGTGANQTVSLTAATTLSDLKTAINALGAGVTASVVNDGTSAAPNYRLVLTSDSTGTDNALTIVTDDTTLGVSSTLQSAANAAFTVDGLSLTRSSNTVTDVITGVTLNLLSADNTKTVTVSVARDTTEIKKKIAALVDKYNSVVNYIKANNRYDKESKVAGPLYGDAVARSVYSDLSAAVGVEISGLSSTMNRLIHAGVKRDASGTMSVDSSTLSTALDSNFTGVVNLFIDSTSTGGTTKGFGYTLYTLASDMTDFVDGRINLKQKGITDNISRIDQSIEKKQKDLDKYEANIRAQFTQLEVLLAGLKNQGSFLSRF